MSNILGEGFPEEINKQIENRQILYGASFENGIDRSDSVLKYLNANTAWCKLVSSTNITNKDIIQNETLSTLSNIEGNNLAKKFVLFNGTSINGDNRSGIDYGNNILSDNAYGIGGNEFGIQPMMGIKSVDVKHLNNGSLRKATVQIKAFNRTQFDIIDVLYLRLGFSILLEWGHSIFLDKRGVVRSNIDSSLSENFLSGTTYPPPDDPNSSTEPLTYKTFLGYIDSMRKQTSGNYDAMFARVVNFHWSFLPDGSYDITLDLISIGDVVDSFKINTLNPTTSASTSKVNTQDQKDPTTEELIDLYANKSTIGQYLFRMKNSMATENSRWGIVKHFDYDINWYTGKLLKLDPKAVNLTDGVSYNKRDFPTQYYCRLGNFLEFIQKYVIYQVGTNSNNKTNSAPLLNFDTNIWSNLMYVHPMQVSVDPTICMVNKDLTIRDKDYWFFPYGEPFLNPEIKSSTNAQYGQIMNIYINFKFILNKMDELKNLETGEITLIDFFQSILSGINGALGSLNKLDLFIDEVTNTVKIIDKNPLPDYEHVIKYLNSKIESELTTKSLSDKQLNTIRNRYKLYDQYATFYLYGYEVGKKGTTDSPPIYTKAGFIKDFSFKTEITPQMSTMISAAAAANNTTIGENTTALSRLNSGLKDRFKESMFVTDPSAKKDIVEKYHDIYNQVLKQYDFTYKTFIGYLTRISTGQWTLEEVDTYKDILVNTLKYTQQYDKVYKATVAAKNGKSQEEIDKILSAIDNSMNPSTGFIPFNLSLTMDGLSGMKINSKFKIDTSYLPSNYPNTVDFLIKNEAHKIENNKWTTTLESYCISKGDFSEIKEKDIDPQGQNSTPQTTTSTNTNPTTTSTKTNTNIITGRYSTALDNNPFNLRPNGGSQFNGYVGSKEGFRGDLSIGLFAVFDTKTNGIRAGMKNLEGYFTRRNLKTISQIINTYAPAGSKGQSQANTNIYINNVVAYMKQNWNPNITASTVLSFAGPSETNPNNIKMFKTLVEAIARQEGKLTPDLVADINSFDIKNLA